MRQQTFKLTVGLDCFGALEVENEPRVRQPIAETIGEVEEIVQRIKRLRGKLLRSAIGDRLDHMQFVGRTREEVERAIDDGRFTFLFDENGKFIKNSFAHRLGRNSGGLPALDKIK